MHSWSISCTDLQWTQTAEPHWCLQTLDWSSGCGTWCLPSPLRSPEHKRSCYVHKADNPIPTRFLPSPMRSPKHTGCCYVHMAWQIIPYQLHFSHHHWDPRNTQDVMSTWQILLSQLDSPHHHWDPLIFFVVFLNSWKFWVMRSSYEVLICHWEADNSLKPMQGSFTYRYEQYADQDSSCRRKRNIPFL